MNTRRPQRFTLSIGDVARRTGLATSALRFYEEKALIESIRTPGNQRCYTRDVIRRVSFIRAAQRVGLSLEEIRAVLDDLPAGRTPTREDWDRLARRWTPWLDERIAALERLRDKLSSCIGCGCLSLDTCALYNPDDAAGRLGPGPRYLLGDSLRVTSPRVGIHTDAE
ncbi:MAG: redox-sensitive transcriptional activator SoxR [Rhodospirillales bacterium]|nr:redox-sensitive transcriptional activator SoxR [Rhodospirillales bacterium]MDE0378157.1 redox-sensitive transcriptional activator SoxR [Rhodospirillales bacterium]